VRPGDNVSRDDPLAVSHEVQRQIALLDQNIQAQLTLVTALENYIQNKTIARRALKKLLQWFDLNKQKILDRGPVSIRSKASGTVEDIRSRATMGDVKFY
jgi:hypothetical protein